MKTEIAKISLAVIDDHNLFRKGLIKLIQLADPHNRYQIIFEKENGLELQKTLKEVAPPEIILMDINMPGMDGFETVEWLKMNHPNVKVLVVSMLETEDAILKMLRLGVKGYLSKDMEVKDMHRALEAIANGDIYYAGFVSEYIGMMGSGFTKDEPSEFSETDLQFLKMICSDDTYEQIADLMCKSIKTIDGYRAKFFKRFNVKSRQGLAVYVITNGIIAFD